MLLESAFRKLFCLQFSFKSVTFSNCYICKLTKVDVFFSENSVYIMHS